MLKVVIFYIKEKFEDEKADLGKKKLKQLVLAKNQRFKFGSRLILKKTSLAVSAFLQS